MACWNIHSGVILFKIIEKGGDILSNNYHNLHLIKHSLNWLYEASLSAANNIKNKNRSSLESLEKDLKEYLPKIRHSLNDILKKHQVQIYVKLEWTEKWIFFYEF